MAPLPTMIAAFLAASFFAFNATCANRSIALSGTMRANLSRLVVGAAVLGLFAHTLGGGFGSAGTGWFLLSGLVGVGLGDLGGYAALPLLGSRLTVLMIQCLAAPIAALGEWWWLGTRLTAAQVAWGAVILGGVALALMPSRAHPPRVRVRAAGFFYGIFAAFGQGIGAALISRKGVMVAVAAGERVGGAGFGLTVAYERILAGLVFMAAWVWGMRLLGRLPPAPAADPAARRAGWRWMIANGLAGPVAGVGCYQWALATTPSGVVLPIAATTPLLSIPITYWLEGDRPTRRSIAGGVVAVVGCAALAIASSAARP